MAKAKKPTGLKIVRNKKKFICEWRCGAKNYDEGQTFQYSLSGGKWKTLATKPKKRKKTVTVELNNYNPHTSNLLTEFHFRVKGNARNDGKGYSDWNDAKLILLPPLAPTVTLERDSNRDFVSTITWTAQDEAENRPYDSIKAQTMFVKDITTTKGEDTDWTNATTASDGEYAETLSISNDESWTRWFRVCAQGAAGDSEWVYRYHTYAKPIKPTDVKASVVEDSNGYEVHIEWKQSVTPARPCESVELQYWMIAPADGLEVPTGSGWQTARTVAGYDGSNNASFHIDDTLADEQSLFVRVVAVHDTDKNPSDAYIAKYGVLTAPENLTITNQDNTQYRVSITADNASSVTDSKLVLLYKPASYPQGYIIAVSSEGNGTKTFNNIQCPDWSGESAVAFGVYAVVGTAVATNGIAKYTIKAYTGKEIISSATETTGGAIPIAPTNVDAIPEGEGTVTVMWDWNDATSAELSWADHADAWDSTEEPNTYVVDGTHAGWWRIVNLDAGQWWFRVRYVSETDGKEVYGPYSDIIMRDLSAAPIVPNLYITPEVTTDEVTCYWDYTSGDGTSQAYAEVCEATYTSQGIEYGEPIGYSYTEPQIVISAKELGWTLGSKHYLCVSLVSASGKRTERVENGSTVYWSEPVAVVMATKPTVSITNPFTHEEIVEYDDDDPTEVVSSYECDSLKSLPLTVSVTGADTTTTLSVYIERSQYYNLDRPDESIVHGYEGEIVFNASQLGVSTIIVTRDELIGSLDDGGRYNLVAEVRDTYGQVATDSIPFEVHWTHQAVVPEATVTMYKGVPKITIIQPEEYQQGDTCDIYRLSADKPVLIYEGAEFGEVYTDPYPAIGELGGHRIVYRTADGDYTTEDGGIAWTDLHEEQGDIFASKKSVIDYGLEQVELYYNQDFSSQWAKDFQSTAYLGGHVEGDWNPAVVRTATISTVMLPLLEQDAIDGLRRLADYAGICHVRTIDGSSYAADVQVSESRNHDKYGQVVEFQLTTTRVDSQQLDGMTFEEWAAIYDHLIMPDGNTVEMPDGYILSTEFGEA